jgi:hypothetical protein
MCASGEPASAGSSTSTSTITILDDEPADRDAAIGLIERSALL